MPTKAPRKKSKNVQRRLTVSLDEKVYVGLHSKYGRGLSRFIETLVRPYVIQQERQEADRKIEKQKKPRPNLVRPIVSKKELDRGYRAMAADKVREAEAHEWCEALIGDVADEAR